MAKRKSKRRTLSAIEWEQLASNSQFQALRRKKNRFIICATLFFVLYYFALPIGTGYFTFLNTTLIGSVNGAYLFALSQFFMAWILAIIYVRHANKLDQLIEELIPQQRRKSS